jgi:hypothetical protein
MRYRLRRCDCNDQCERRSRIIRKSNRLALLDAQRCRRKSCVCIRDEILEGLLSGGIVGRNGSGSIGNHKLLHRGVSGHFCRRRAKYNKAKRENDEYENDDRYYPAHVSSRTWCLSCWHTHKYIAPTRTGLSDTVCSERGSAFWRPLTFCPTGQKYFLARLLGHSSLPQASVAMPFRDPAALGARIVLFSAEKS